MVTVKIHLFARFAERAGEPIVELSFEKANEQVSVQEIKERLSELWPDLAALIQQSFFAKNMAYALPDETVSEKDEVAILPPVSGGDATEQPFVGTETDSLFVLTYEEIQPNEVLRKVIDTNHGASILFVGTTREWTEGMQTTHLAYEAYAPMALKTMEQIAKEIDSLWPGTRMAMTHRLGNVNVAETSIAIAVSSGHRGNAYEASRHAIERVKEIVPIWKKEIWADGSEWKGHQTGPWNPLARKEPSDV